VTGYSFDAAYGIAYARVIMKTLNATEARKNLYRLLDEIAVTNEPVQITGKRASAVLISVDDWHALEETVYLTSIAGVADSIREGLQTPIEECVEELDW